MVSKSTHHKVHFATRESNIRTIVLLYNFKIHFSNAKIINKMKTRDFTATILVDQAAGEAFDAIKNLRGWWSEEIEGETGKLNETFFYHYKDVHLCKIRLTESVPGKRLVYLVVKGEFNFTSDREEWTNTRFVFDISNEGGKTKIKFTHEGLIPEHECYDICDEAWTNYIKKSLYDLITTGKGQPNPKDADGFNAAIVKKWKLEAI
jgi:hypothetical protein